MTDARAVGAINIRLEIPWPVIEVARGAYDWSRSDELFQAAAQVGIAIDPVLMWTPQWAGGGTALNAAPPPTDMQSFAQAFAQRYDAQVRSGIEIWNEPDNGSYLNNGSAATYVSQILNPAYAGIKSVDGAIPVILGGPVNDAGTCCPFLSAVRANGGHFDIASFHNYAGGAVGEAQSYRSILGSGVPIWLGEYGVQSNKGDQLGAISQVLGSPSAISIAQWYNLRDTAAWTCCPPNNVDQAHWGLLNSDFSSKPSWTTMESLLTGRTAPPPVSSLAGVPGSSTASTSSGGGGSGQSSSGPQGSSLAGSTEALAGQPQIPRSPVAVDDAARSHVAAVQVDPPLFAQRAVAGPTLAQTWLQPWLLAPVAAVIVASSAVVAIALRRRRPTQPSSVRSPRTEPLDAG